MSLNIDKLFKFSIFIVNENRNTISQYIDKHRKHEQISTQGIAKYRKISGSKFLLSIQYRYVHTLFDTVPIIIDNNRKQISKAMSILCDTCFFVSIIIDSKNREITISIENVDIYRKKEHANFSIMPVQISKNIERILTKSKTSTHTEPLEPETARLLHRRDVALLLIFFRRTAITRTRGKRGLGGSWIARGDDSLELGALARAFALAMFVTLVLAALGWRHMAFFFGILGVGTRHMTLFGLLGDDALFGVVLCEGQRDDKRTKKKREHNC
jgi:hypothetical protein